jgi:Icc-related predicted phosphoesterase
MHSGREVDVVDYGGTAMTLSRRQFLAAMAISSFGAPRLLSELRSSSVPAKACTWVKNLDPKSIIIVGDVQRTSLAELSFMGRGQYDQEREAILNAIADDKPDLLVMLGDQVVAGDDEAQWTYFDECMARVNAQSIPVHSLLGNHDYGENKMRCLRNYGERFPHLEGSVHNQIRLGSLAMISVNTNFDMLSSSQIKNQEVDYNKWISELDADPSVRAIIVASHHPPYTNSDLGVNTDVESMFAKPFLSANKTRLYLAGHVHSYERFIAGEKTFVTSGGGGGPRRLVDNSSSRPFKNDAYRIGTLRPFHYIRVKVGDSDLKAEVVMLQKGTFKVGDRFAVPI